MATTSKYRDNNIIYKNNQWIFEDTQRPVSETKDTHVCGHCNQLSTEEGHDACLGTLIGLMNACCGHGNPKEAYVQFIDGNCVRGEDAVMIQNILKRWKPDQTHEEEIEYTEKHLKRLKDMDKEDMIYEIVIKTSVHTFNGRNSNVKDVPLPNYNPPKPPTKQR